MQTRIIIISIAFLQMGRATASAFGWYETNAVGAEPDARAGRHSRRSLSVAY